MALLHTPADGTRPPGVSAVAGLCLAGAVLCVSFAVLTFTGAVPLSAGAFLLGGGMEQLGPGAFLLCACVMAAIGWALVTRKKWARRITILLAAAGIAMAVSAVSSAVVDGRAWAIVREGLQIIVRVVVIFYLSQEPVRDWFAG